MKTIFAVDDSDTNLAMAEEALEAHYRLMTMPSAAKMFTLLDKFTPDLILLDIEMPEMNGIEALQRLKCSPLYEEIPVIFLTGRTDSAIEAYGFELGAVDFITKPFSAPVLLNRIKTHLNISKVVREQTTQLYRLQNGIVSVLANMVESRDKMTKGHIERTMAYIKILLKAMEERGVYADEIRSWDQNMASSSSRLHDVGKIVISDVILNKPGKLTGDEYEIIKSHVSAGERIINSIVDRSVEEEFLHNAKLFAGYHHERWDGSGYPRGLKETEIPLQGRIMALVDVYDALISERPYKKAFTAEKAEGIIQEGAGKLFDPKITAVFFEVKDLIREVVQCLSP